RSDITARPSNLVERWTMRNLLPPALVAQYWNGRQCKTVFRLFRSCSIDPTSRGGTVIAAAGQTIGTHERSFRRGPLVLDSIRYLATLEHRPRAVDHALVRGERKLRRCFSAFVAPLRALQRQDCLDRLSHRRRRFDRCSENIARNNGRERLRERHDRV